MRFIFIINDIYALDPSYQYTYFGDDQVNFIDFKLQDIDAEQNLLINFSNKNKKKYNDSDDSISEKNNNNNGKQIFNFEDDDKNSESADDDEKENEKDESIDIENNNNIENYVEIPNIIEISNRNKTENNISKDYTKKNKKKKHKKDHNNNNDDIRNLSEMLSRSPRKTHKSPSKNFSRWNKYEKDNLSVTYSTINCDITDEKRKIKRIKTRSILKDRSVHRKLNGIEKVHFEKKVSFGVIKYSY